MDGYILIVEDDPDFRHVLSAFVNFMGMKRIMASDGDEAIVRLNQQKPALVLLDLMMPGKSGLEVFRYIRDNPDTADTPILILSAMPLTVEQTKTLDGPTKIISKGNYEFADVRLAISELLPALT